jgi:hypothetical protein
MSYNTLFISEQTLKDRSVLDQNVDNKLITTTIKYVQDTRMQEVCGTTLYEKLVTDLNTNGTLSGNYKTLVDLYLTDMLIWFTLAELTMILNYKFFNKGVMNKSADDANPVSIDDLDRVKEYYWNKGEYYEARAIKHLRQSVATNLYPEYLTWRVGIDVIKPKYTGYSSTIPMEVPLPDVPFSELFQGSGQGIDFDLGLVDGGTI